MQRAFGTIKRAEQFADNNELPYLNAEMIEFIEQVQTMVLATTDRRYNCDAAIRFGHPGFVTVIDQNWFAFPDYNGNGVFASLGNIWETTEMAALFLDFDEFQIGLHVEGSAWVVNDSGLREYFPELPRGDHSGRIPERWVLIQVRKAFIQCRKYLPRMVRTDDGRERAATDPVRLRGGDFFNVKDTKRAQSANANPQPPEPRLRLAEGRSFDDLRRTVSGHGNVVPATTRSAGWSSWFQRPDAPAAGATAHSIAGAARTGFATSG